MINFKTTEPVINVPADEKTLIAALNLSPMEARFIQALLNTNNWVGRDELPEIKYSTRQLVYKMRMKLDPMKIFIINDGNHRYSLTPGSKEVIRNAIERLAA